MAIRQYRAIVAVTHSGTESNFLSKNQLKLQYRQHFYFQKVVPKFKIHRRLLRKLILQANQSQKQPLQSLVTNKLFKFCTLLARGMA